MDFKTLLIGFRIRKIEDALKKEFNAKERRAKAEYKASIAANKPVVPNNNNKRKHEDSPVAAINNFSNCNIILGHNGTFSQPSSSINGTQPAAKRVKKPAPDPAHSSPKSSKVRGVSGSKSTDSLSAPLPILKSKKSSTETGTAAKNDLKLQIDSKAKKELKTKYESKDKSEPKAKPEVKPKGKAKKETIIKSESKVKREPNVKKEPKVKAENKVKSERAIKTEDLSSPVQSTFSPIPSPTSSCPSLGLLNGIYDLQSAAMSPDASMTLAVDGSQLWGAFNFGQSFGGLISFPRRPYRASNEPLSCQWRSYPRDGRTMGSGRVSFMGDGHIHGSFHGGAVQFQGCRRQGPAYTPRPPASYQEEWEYIHDINDGDGDNGQYESSDEDSAQFEDSMDGIKYYD